MELLRERRRWRRGFIPPPPPPPTGCSIERGVAHRFYVMFVLFCLSLCWALCRQLTVWACVCVCALSEEEWAVGKWVWEEVGWQHRPGTNNGGRIQKAKSCIIILFRKNQSKVYDADDSCVAMNVWKLNSVFNFMLPRLSRVNSRPLAWVCIVEDLDFKNVIYYKY